MRIAEALSRMKQKKIDKKDLALAIMAFLVVAMIFFVWYYLKVKENPLDTAGNMLGVKHRYYLSIYDPEKMKRPLGVAVSPWNEVFVADSINHRIAVFDRMGKFKRVLGKPGVKAGEFNYPTSVAISGSKIYVADFYNQRVQVLDQEGKSLYNLPSSKDRTELGPVIMPITLTTDQKGNLYVSDLSKQRILIFDDGGNLTQVFGKAGSNPGELSYVNGIAVNEEAEGKIYLANSNNGRIDEFSLDGEFLRTLPVSKAFLNPKGLFFDQEEGILYAVDTFAHKVVGINKEGNVVESIGSRGIETGAFSFPNAVTRDRSGRLYIADRENNRVEVYTK